MTADQSFFLRDEQTTLAFGSLLAKTSPSSCLIFLKGELGAGKTTLVRGFLRGLGFNGHVKSPTYTLVEPYYLESVTVYHFDLYRLQSPEELELIGIRDYLVKNAICIIEWPEHGATILPKADLCCYIHTQNSGRHLHVQANSATGSLLLKHLSQDDFN